jgi:hypothetical protein
VHYFFRFITCYYFLFLSGLGCTKDQNPPDLQSVKSWLHSSETNTEKKFSEDALIEKIQAGKKFELLKPWAFLFEASWNLQKEDKNAAKEALSNIPDHNPAFLDASLLNIKMALQDPRTSNYFERELVLLEAQILKMNQTELIPELLHTMALSFEKKKDFHSALNIYQKIRSQYPESIHAGQAKKTISSLKNGTRAPLPSQPLADQLEEAKILILEKDFQKAYELLQNAKKNTQKNIPAYYEITINEVDLLMASKRKSEALLLLSMIKEKAPATLAARAFLTLIHIAYNDRELTRALDLIDDFEKRFFGKHFHEEIQFILAKIKKETGNLDEAKELFIRILDNKPSLKTGLESLRQLAWITYIKNDLKESARYFNLLLEQSSDVSQLLFETNNSTPSNILIEEYLPYSEKYSLKRKVHTESKELIHEIGEKVYFLLSHATYWLSHIQEQEKNLDSSKNLSSSLKSSFPFSYYTMLTHQDQTHALSIDPIKENEAICFSRYETYKNRSKLLMKANLHTEAIRQMSWDYSFNKEDDETNMSLSVLLPIHIAGIMQELSLIPQSIKYLEREFPLWKVQKYYLSYLNEKNCKKAYLSVRYPLLYPELLKKMVSSNNIPVSLLFSIHRNHLSLDKQELEKLAKSLKEITQNDSPLPYLLIMLFGSKETKAEVIELRERYSHLGHNALLELISDTQLRDNIQKIMLDAAWYKTLNH